MPQVGFRNGRAEEIRESSFDIAYARLLLVHVNDPRA